MYAGTLDATVGELDIPVAAGQRRVETEHFPRLRIPFSRVIRQKDISIGTAKVVCGH